jgi:hypothetical protein
MPTTNLSPALPPSISVMDGAHASDAHQVAAVASPDALAWGEAILNGAAVVDPVAPSKRERSTRPRRANLVSMQDDLGGVWAPWNALIVATGKRDMEQLRYFKSVAFHQWLFNIEVAGPPAVKKSLSRSWWPSRASCEASRCRECRVMLCSRLGAQDRPHARGRARDRICAQDTPTLPKQ